MKAYARFDEVLNVGYLLNVLSMAIRAGPQWRETVSSQWKHLRPLNYWVRPSVVRDNEQSVAIP